MGWEPEERHEHFDAEGNLTGWTVVTREVEWDDVQRDRMQALEIYEAGVGDCGFHHDLTSDKRNHFTFADATCPVCAAAEKYARMQHAADTEAVKQFGENGPPPDVVLPSDGRRTYIRQMDPREVSDEAAD